MVLALPVSAVGPSGAADTEPAQLTDVTVVTARDVTRIEIKTTVPARYETTFVEEPSQLVLDFDPQIAQRGQLARCRAV